MAAMWPGWTGIPPTSNLFSLWIKSSLFFTCFLSFARRFWNQIFTCRSVKLRAWASSAFLHLLPFLCTSVLEPDFPLPFCQVKSLGKFSFSPDCDVSAVVELLFQLESLVVGVNDPVFV